MTYARRGYHYRRHVFRLGVGSDGGAVRGYKSGSFGGLEAHRLNKIAVDGVSVGPDDQFLLNLGPSGDTQIGDVTAIRVKFPAFSEESFTAAWSGSGYVGAGPAGLTAWITPKLGSNVKLIMRGIVDSIPAGFFLKRVSTGNSLYGYRSPFHPTSAFGTLAPQTYGGLDVWQFRCHGSPGNATAVFELDDGSRTGGAQIPGITVVRVEYSQGPSGDYTWNGQRYERIDVDISTFLVGNLSSPVLVRVTQVS